MSPHQPQHGRRWFGPNLPGALRRLTATALATGIAGLAALALPAQAAIPAAERAVLIDLYNRTNGDGWLHNTGWKTGGNFSAAGTECTWFGVTCSAGDAAVSDINLADNNLVGTLPPTLNQLTALKRFSTPANQLSGPIPPLEGLSGLLYFNAVENQLSGAIPSLAGLSALTGFYVHENQLSGAIPSLAGLTSLLFFRVHDNQLSGTPPAAPAALDAGNSSLCPNLLRTPSPTDSLWNTATGGTWSTGCTPGYLVSANAGSGGRVSPPQGVQAGQTATVLLTPDTNYIIDTAFSTCGGALVGNTFTTGPVNADCTVTAAFRTAPGTITPSVHVPGPFGTGVARCTPAMPGETSTCTATAAPGFVLQSIEGCAGTPSTTSPYITAPITAACLVTVRFGPVAITPVPTLGQWALMVLGLLLAVLGLRRVRKAD